MTDVQFREPQYQRSQTPQTKGPSYLSRLVITLGLAKEERGAQQVLLVIAVLAILGAGAIGILGGTSGASPQELEEEVLRG